jgi:c-di-GMP-binding flagellar brake protein YcgR
LAKQDLKCAPMAINRRASRRIPFRKKVKYGLSDSLDSTFTGYTFNLSEGGVGIKAHRVFPPRSKVSIQIHISDVDLGESSMNDIIKLDGTVAWVSPILPGILPTMGIKFSNRSRDIKQIYESKSRGNITRIHT